MPCHRNSLKSTTTLILGITLIATMAACRYEPRSGVPRSVITITVTQQGSPVKIGTVDIVNKESGEGASANLDEFGMVTLTGISHGEYAVTIQPPPSLTSDGRENPRTGKYSVDSKYQSVEKSPLTMVIDGKSNSFEFTVE